MDHQNGLGAISYDTSFIRQRIVEGREIDVLGHMNNTVYVQWIQDIAVAHWQHVAPPELVQPFVWVCLRHEIDYRVPLLEGEVAEVRTWLGARSGARFDRHVQIQKVGADKWSARAITTWVMIDRVSGKPRRVGDDVLAAFGLPRG